MTKTIYSKFLVKKYEFALISGCLADLKTKEIAKTNLKDNSIVLIENAFDLRYVENHAIAFGFLSSIKKSIRIPLIFLLTISVTMFAFVMIWKIKNKKFRLLLPFFYFDWRCLWKYFGYDV